MPKDFQKAIELHNNFRKNHNVNELIWDTCIAEIAQRHANKLVENNKFEHGLLLDKNGNRMGQNLYTIFSYKIMSLSEKSCNAVESWYKEVDLYDFSNQFFDIKTQNFTQLVWAKTEKIGIGVATKDNRTVVVANYFPQGNILNLYQTNVFPKIENFIEEKINKNIVKKLEINNIYTTLDSFSKKDGRGNESILLYNSTEPLSFIGYELIPKIGFIEEFPSEFRIEGSNDNGKTWEILDKRTAVSRKVNQYNFIKNVSFKLIQFIVTRSSYKNKYGYGRLISLNNLNLIII